MIEMSGMIRELRQGAGQAWRRFFSAIICAWLTGIAALILSIGDFDIDGLERIPLCLALGIPLFIGLHLLKFSSRRWRPWVFILGATALAALTLWMLEQDEDPFFLRYVLLSVAVHLFAGCAPFFNDPNEMRLWCFNRALLANLLTTWFFGLFLWGGLALLLWLAEILFGLKQSSDSPVWVFLGIMFFFQPWHFCSRVPDPKEKSSLDPGRAVVFFSRYILMPLIFLHGIGLMIYMVLTAVTRVWPKPESAVLVSLHAGFGLLSVVLVWPLVRQKKSWAWYYQRSYFLLTPCLLVLLFVGQLREAWAFGLDPTNYSGLVAATVILALCAFSWARPKLNLRWIPLSFMAVALALAVGPLGAMEVAFRQQKSSLKNAMQKQGLLSEAGPQALSKDLSFQERALLSRRLDKAYELLGQEGVALVLGHAVESSAENFLEARKIRYVNSWTTEEEKKEAPLPVELYLGPPEEEAMPLFGRAYLVEPKLRFKSGAGFVPMPNTVSIHLNKKKQVLLVYLGDKVASELSLKPSLQRLLALPDVHPVAKGTWTKKRERHWEDLVLASRLPSGLGTLVATSLSWVDNGKPLVTEVSVKLFADKPFDVDGKTPDKVETDDD